MLNIDTEPVLSSHISEIGYDEQTRVLRVVFNDGSMYDYDDVSKEIFTGLRQASSAGRYFKNYVKERYRFVRIE